MRARVVSGDGPRRRISRWQWKREAALGPHKPSISSAGASPFGSTGEDGLQPGARAREEADLRADIDGRLAPRQLAT